jgi:hypothetical protein
MSKAPDISIVIPIHNEEGNIPQLFERLKRVISTLDLTYELIFVNDGSVAPPVQTDTLFADPPEALALYLD